MKQRFRLSVDVRVDLLPTKAGGRSQPIVSGYRPLCILEGADGEERSFGLCELQLADSLAPGDSDDGRLSFDIAVSDEVRALLGVGNRLTLAEGAKRIGSAEVRAIES
jgi:hypothetical protein